MTIFFWSKYSLLSKTCRLTPSSKDNTNGIWLPIIEGLSVTGAVGIIEPVCEIITGGIGGFTVEVIGTTGVVDDDTGLPVVDNGTTGTTGYGGVALVVPAEVEDELELTEDLIAGLDVLPTLLPTFFNRFVIVVNVTNIM